MNLGKEEHLKVLWSHQKDKSYQELASHYLFMDVLAASEFKLYDILIPETILLESSGEVDFWIHNSKHDHNNPIIKKPVAKLRPEVMLKHFEPDRNQVSKVETVKANVRVTSICKGNRIKLWQ